MDPTSPPKDLIVWPPLIPGTLIKRYKRFLADVRLSGGEVVTAHCPNTGAMTTCSEPGRPVFISHHDNPKRKLAYTWQMIDMGTSLVGVNTQLPNRLVAKAIRTGKIIGLKGYSQVTREIQVEKGTRLDLLLQASRRRNCYVEVKNCTLVEATRACFPDAVTRRGAKHIDALINLLIQGHRGVMFYLVQRSDAVSFQPADHIDPEYGQKLRQAAAQGLEILAYDTKLDLAGIRIGRQLPVNLSDAPADAPEDLSIE